MSKLAEKAASLLNEGAVNLIIGYEEGSKKPRPFFCDTVAETGKLIYDSQCIHNLAVYLTKPELLRNGRAGIIATIPTLKSIVQLALENQLNEERLIVLTATKEEEVILFSGFEEIKTYLAKVQSITEQKQIEMIEKLDAMTREERWQFWQKELSQCFKCYACRAACPMCYCTRCIVEVNCPQWVQPWSSPLGNMEWQINRAMHLAGRCTGCGACSEACPLGIPIHLLTKKMAEDIGKEFGVTSGQTYTGNVLSTFKPEDKEEFIH